MPYIKTKDGKIGKILSANHKKKTCIVEFDYGCPEINYNDKNIKYAENLYDLCDDLLFLDDNNKPHYLSVEGNIWYIGFASYKKNAFGIIYSIDEKGVFHIKTIAEIDQEGGIRLL